MPSLTVTPTPTPTLTARGARFVVLNTPTATPPCGPVVIYGTVYESTSVPARNKRVIFEVRNSEALPNGCVARPSLYTYVTDSEGVLPPGALVLGGALVLITIEGGIASEVQMPIAGPVDIAPLLQSPTPAITTGGTASVTVSGVDQYRLGVSLPWGYGPVILSPQQVRGLSLTADSSAGGQRISDNGVPMVNGDGLSIGTTVGGDLTGNLPFLAYQGAYTGSVVTGIVALAAGSCTTSNATVTGARIGMVSLASPTSSIATPLTWESRIVGNDTVAVQICAVGGGTTLVATTFNVRAFGSSAVISTPTPSTPAPTSTPTRGPGRPFVVRNTPTP